MRKIGLLFSSILVLFIGSLVMGQTDLPILRLRSNEIGLVVCDGERLHSERISETELGVECVSRTTPEPTVSPTREPTQLPTTPAPTPEPTTPAPGVHDTSLCHSEVIDGHTHGICPDDLPDGAIKDWVADHPLFQEIGTFSLSSPTENLFPFPVGKHEGFKRLYEEYDTCHQFANIPGRNDGICVKAVYLQLHSLGDYNAVSTFGADHSSWMIVEVMGCEGDCVVQVAEIEDYGEIHAKYKKESCYGVNGVQYPDAYTISQPPYVAQQGGRDGLSGGIFWSALRNALMGNVYGEVNNLMQVAWSEAAWGLRGGLSDTCPDAANNIQYFTSTNDGFRNIYAIWTMKAFISDFPRPYEGFTTRDGRPAEGCTQASFDCLPIYIGADVPANDDVSFNLPVTGLDGELPPDVQIIDITKPDVYAPGFWPGSTVRSTILEPGRIQPTRSPTPVVTNTPIPPQEGNNILLNGDFTGDEGEKSFAGWQNSNGVWENSLHDSVSCSPSGTAYLQMDRDLPTSPWQVGVEDTAWQDVSAPEHTELTISYEEAQHIGEASTTRRTPTVPSTITLTVYGRNGTGQWEVVYLQSGVRSPFGTGKCIIAPPAVFKDTIELPNGGFEEYRVEVYGKLLREEDGVLWGNFELTVN